MKSFALALVLFFISPPAFAQHRTPQEAREELGLGVKAYHEADYRSAAQHFQRAALLDGDLCVARLYLATVFAQQYVPGVESKDNLAMAEKAVEQYQETLKCQPDTVKALQGIGYLKLQMKQFDEARGFYRRALKLDKEDPELYYSVGRIDWRQAYQNTADQKAQLAPKMTSPLILDPACPGLRAQNLPLVEEGLEMLTQAVRLRKEYVDAMAYINLLYRQRSEIECGDPAASKADEDKANEWSDRVMEALKRKVENQRKCAGRPLLDKECPK